MPGVVMDNNIGGDRLGSNSHDPKKAISPTSGNFGQPGGSLDLWNGSLHVNGVVRDGNHRQDVELPASKSVTPKGPPELLHITQGFFPFSKLINRSVQQCWNDLSELIAELAEIQVPQQDSTASPLPPTGKSPGNQSSENLRKKLRALDFTHGKRAEFIKLLVLSKWSRQAADVSKLIDLQSLIRTQHQAYAGALQWVGDMKRDLVRAQVANPDLDTALEVLSMAGVSSMSDLGYKPPKPLTPRSTLKKLRKINRIISARLALNETIPAPFQTYRVHDGRATFVVPGEFELDLSVGEENENSQFFFVDIRFLFTPSSSIPTGRIFSELDHKVNDILRDSGLIGCYDFLHSLVLTNKINILAKQAAELARGLWSNVLRIELLHRTLVLQYWALKPGAKSWLEIGIRRGDRRDRPQDRCSPSLGLRWMRDGREADSGDIEFDTENLRLERLLRSVIATHISHILSSAYVKIADSLLFSSGSFSLRAQLTRAEPGDCHLDIQLTASRNLRVAIEPMSGASILSATPNVLERHDSDRSPDRSMADDIVSRVARIRCNAAIEEVESRVEMLGFELVNPRGLRLDARRIFPPNVLRFSFFWHHLWDRSWILAATSSMDGDNWWVVQTRPTEPSKTYSPLDSSIQTQYALSSAQIISKTLLPTQKQIKYSSLADLAHCLSGTLAIHANARYLMDLQLVNFYPPLHHLKLNSGLQVPDLIVRYESSNLPRALKIALPNGLKKKALIKETIRLAFHGVDPQNKVAMMVAYGNLAGSSKTFSSLIPAEDRSLVFQRAGTGFALRLFAPIGHPIILGLLENLQRLECVLSIFESLRRKKLEPRSLSLSRIDFAYGPDKDLTASLDIGISKPSSPLEVDPAKVASKTDCLFHLRLGICFNHPNPHRRIQDTLALNMNRASTDGGLDTIAEILTFTLPLMRALDRIMANPSYNAAFKMQVIVRNAKTYQIHFPQERYRFQLVASQHLGRLIWILKDFVDQDNAGLEQLRSRLQETLYTSKGNGWRGLGNGVVVEADQVGNLLDELDKCLTSARNDSLVKPEASKVKPSTPDNSGQSATKGATGHVEGINSRDGVQATKTQHKTGPMAPKADVIMID